MAPTEPTRPAKIYFAALALVVAGIVAYANSLGGPFIFDDPSSIVANPTIRSLWPPWAPLFPPHAAVTVQGRPVLNFSLALNYAVSGANPWSYHALNLAIHLAAGLALFGLVRRTLLRPLALAKSGCGVSPQNQPTHRRDADAIGLAFMIALLWLVHPLQTESITYTIQRAESLMGLFYLLTLYAFARATECHVIRDTLPAPGLEKCHVIRDTRPARGAAGWLGLSVLACALGMATKEVMVSAPLVVLLYDRAFVAGSFAAALQRRRIFYAGLAATWLVLVACVLSTGGNRGGSAGFDVGVKWWDYELTQFRAIAHYLRLVFWPAPLVFEYGSFWIEHATDVLLEMVAVFALAGGTLWAVARRPAIGFIGCWFFASLAVTSLVPGTTQMIVEHRMYLPLAAVIAAVVLGLDSVFRSGRAWVRWVLWVPWVLFVPCVILTHARNTDYRSELAIWGDTVAKRPNNALAHEMFGQALDRAGRHEEAAEHHTASLKIFPEFAVAHVSLGDDLVRAGKIAEAIPHYEAALRTKPDYVDAHHELGIALARAGRKEEALGHFETTLRLKPDFADAHFDAANALAALGRAAEAATHYEAALKVRPDYPAAHFNYANLLADTGKPAEAVPHYRAAIDQRPDYPEAFNNLGGALLDLGRNADAIAAYEAALRLRPGFRDARENLARVRAAPR